MKKYIIKNKQGVEFTVNKEELFAIANHRIDEWNEFEELYNNNENEYHQAEDWNDVKEIIVEYMECEIEEVEEVVTPTLEMYYAL